MTTRALGEMTLAAAVPGVAAANVQLGALLAAHETARAKLAAQLAVPLPALPDPATLKSAVLASLSLYNPAAALAAMTSVRVSFGVDLAAAASLSAAASPVVASLGAALGAGGLGVYVFDGPAASFGSELSAVAASRVGGASCKALALVTTEAAAWAALSGLMRTA